MNTDLQQLIAWGLWKQKVWIPNLETPSEDLQQLQNFGLKLEKVSFDHLLSPTSIHHLIYKIANACSYDKKYQ